MTNFNKDFPIYSQTILKFPFVVNGKKLIGRLNYVHHDLRVIEGEYNGEKLLNEVKEGLQQRSCRQATIDELEAFLKIYKELLSEFDFWAILATEEASSVKSKKIPGIFLDHAKKKEAFLSAMTCEDGILCGHSNILVLGVEL
ncbi:MAG: hypothetical protein UT05_C0001G0089 [Parcubacteria group bacterium GW2011_GWF2_38_76]|nr:MAG: hypothetical protein UT05_C0001G0089 [Parcubacteria group bacterium GW2011_GWF2_38_76]HBM45935.1 hypothetical protein [Patescibacteria group bacterium]